MTTAIKIEDVSKLYRLGTVGTGTMAHDLNRWWHQIRGKEDPYAKVGQVNDRTQSSTKDQGQKTKNGEAPDYVWALRGINLEVQQGEILGIIGRNGAGKSTLLKLLSRVTAPTTGSIKTKGRIASLLEVGTGFHPELTGRENIYINGAILGMKRHEITQRLDEIVEFSGCAKYLDTPVKRYSSGMMVRLGFAVAAHLDCEILIVDEVLAVGDAEFQSRCLGKMSDVASNGRTVIFVSHNMQSVALLTKHAILMRHGSVAAKGVSGDMIVDYLRENRHQRETQPRGRYDRSEPRVGNQLLSAVVETSGSEGLHTWGSPCTFRFVFQIDEPSSSLCFSFQIVDDMERPVCHFWAFDDNSLRTTPGLHELAFHIPRLRLFIGDYQLNTYLSDRLTNGQPDECQGICRFEVTMGEKTRTNYPWRKGDCVYLEEGTWL